MVVRTLRRRFGAGRVTSLILVVFLQWLASPASHADFMWISDWKVTSLSSATSPGNFNVLATGIADPPQTDFIELSVESVFASQKPADTHTTVQYAQREFQLSGYSEPVQVSIQTVIDGWATFNTFGIKASIFGETGIDNNMQTYQRSMILPGTNHLTINQTRDLYLPNGTYTFMSSLKPSITPSSMMLTNGVGLLDAKMLTSITVVPEPSAFVVIGIGLSILMARQSRLRYLKSTRPK